MIIGKYNFIGVEISGLKVAVTLWAAVIETAQLPVPVQAPAQPEKVDPGSGEAVSMTEVSYE